MEADIRDWGEFAECKKADVDMYPDLDDKEGIRAALAVCAACLVVKECRTYAMENRELLGVWGGMKETQRRTAIRKQRDHNSGVGRYATR